MNVKRMIFFKKSFQWQNFINKGHPGALLCNILIFLLPFIVLLLAVVLDNIQIETQINLLSMFSFDGKLGNTKS